LTSKDFIEPIIEIYDDEDLEEYDELNEEEINPQK
jgi:hypothetical protein